MPISKFKFVSPGVQVAEIDNSQLPASPVDVGPVIIGRAERGPGLVPVQVNSMSEFVEIFGLPQQGDAGNDPWRQGPDTLSPTYGAYAAQAYLRNNSPITFVRLLGYANADNDGTDAAKAGWKVPAPGPGTEGGISPGGAFGLFVVPSGSMKAGDGNEGGADNTAGTAALTGALAAIFYCNSGSAVILQGTDLSGSTVSGSAVVVKASGGKLKALAINSNAVVSGSSGFAGNGVIQIATGSTTSQGALVGNALDASVQFSFNRSDKDYIRKAFNTNPTKTNSNLNDTTTDFWLGETFQNVFDKVVGSAQGGPGSGSGDNYMAFIAPLEDTDNSINYGERKRDASRGRTGWIFAQNTDNNAYGSSDAQSTATKLFRLHTHNFGQWECQNLKVSISDIQAATNSFDDYGTFTVEIRLANDSDEAKQVVESFPLCNLNPNSDDFIAKKIGDRRSEWNATERKYDYYGDYPNQSKYFYVEITEEVRNGDVSPIALPFGFYGPVRFVGFTAYSGSGILAKGAASNGAYASDVMVDASPSNLFARVYSTEYSGSGGTGSAGEYPGKGGLLTSTYQMTGTFNFQEFTTRSGSHEGNLNSPKDAYFGVSAGRPGDLSTYDDSWIDLVRAFPSEISSQDGNAASANQEHSFFFTLDDLSASADGPVVWNSGSAQNSAEANKSINAASSSYNGILALGYDKFTLPVIGGFHGLDVTEMEPFNNARALASGKNQLTSYAVNSARMAVDVVSDPEVVECNMIVMPGVGGGAANETNDGGTQVQDHMLRTCERRADAMTIFDLPGSYTPRGEFGNKYAADNAVRKGNVQKTVDNLNARAINSSYAAAYYPWVQIQDPNSGKNIWVPPSVVALGTYSSSERKSEVWFAPAGFTRGGLTEGSAGLAVTAVNQKLTQKDRDKLYAANINPIASFPAEGIVIFGQKTLQVTPSALDRVNVRRLMLLIKRRVSFIASRLLFEQNVQATWDRFTGQVAPFLDGIVAGEGLLDYKIVLDETTTTPDLIDRNIIYAKIFLKPARAVEFIAIDFVITRTGAAFED